MFRAAILALVLAMPFVMSECDVGDFDNLVISYNVSVVNLGTEPAAITVTIADKLQSATVAPGQRMDVRGFRPGVWHVTIIGASTRKAALKNRYEKFKSELDAMAARGGGIPERLDDDLDDLDDALEKAQDLPNRGTCAGRMDDPGGDTLEVRAEQSGTHIADVSWSC